MNSTTVQCHLCFTWAYSRYLTSFLISFKTKFLFEGSLDGNLNVKMKKGNISMMISDHNNIDILLEEKGI